MPRAELVNLGDGLAGRVTAAGGDRALWIHTYTLDSRCWEPTWAQLCSFSHFGVDLPDHGSSLPLAPGETLPSLGRRIGAVALARGVRHLVGHCLGTVIALQVAIEHPGAFATLTIGAPILGGGPFPRDFWTRYGELKALHAAGARGAALRDAWLDPGSAIFTGSARTPELERSLRRQVVEHPWWGLQDDAVAALWRTPQSSADLATIDLPTLVLVGERDDDAIQQCARFLERLLARCERRELAGASPLCLLDAQDAVAAMIARHWRTAPSAELKGAAGVAAD